MAISDYDKRIYTNSPDETVTYEDFNRIETGIYDNRESLKEHDNKINVLSENVVKKVEINENTDLNTLTDLNTEWITGTNAVAYSCLNTPYSGIKSFNVRNIPVTYAGGSSYFRQFLNSLSGEIFYRDYDAYSKIYSNWIQVATVDMISDLQARVTDLENAISAFSL